MKFLYEYRTSDNALHNGAVSAANRDDAYARLKAQGIKPSRLSEAPGFFNKLFGKGKRWMAIGVLALVCAVLAIAVGRGVLTAPQPSLVERSLETQVRRQLIGDAAIIEKGIRTGWAFVFSDEGDRFLASFAIPGVPAGQRTTTEEKLRDALQRCVGIEENDGLEVRQIKAMVEGMKEEARAFVSKGGSIKRYGQRLVERQDAELAIFEKVRNELGELKRSGADRETLEELWEKRNDELRRMGIKLVSMP